MTNQIQALAILPKLSEQQLLQALQANDGSVPTYAVMAELQARKQRAAGMAGGGAKMPTSSVREEMASSGLQSLGMPPQMQAGTQQYAEGGKIEDEMRAYGYDPMWPKIVDFFRNPSGPDRPLLESLTGTPAWQNPAPPAPAAPAAPYSDARNSGGYGPGTPAPAAAPDALPPRKGLKDSTASGIRSLSVKASGPGGRDSAPAPAGFEFKDLKVRSIADALKDVPGQGALDDQIKAYQDQSGDIAKQRENAKYEALMRAGLIMAKTPGGLGTSIAAGGLEGLNAYGAGMKDANSMERERMKELAMLQQARSAQELQRYGIANATRFGEANLEDKNQDNRFNAYKSGLESSDRRYAADAHVRAAQIAAAAREAASSGNGKIAQLLMQADTTARASIDKNLSDLDKLRMNSQDPAARAKAMQDYEAKVQRAVFDKIGQLSLVEPDLVPLYQRMRMEIGAPAAGPGIIRGNGAPPPGAVVRN